MDNPTPEQLRKLAEMPLDGQYDDTEMRGETVRYFRDGYDVTGRLGGKFLPCGKRDHPSSREQRKVREEFSAKQIDLEDAVEKAGGERGQMLG